MPDSTAEAITRFFKQYPSKQIAKGQILIWADTPPANVYYIKSGRVRQYIIADSGAKATVNIYRRGAFIPMSLILSGLPNKYFFETLEDSDFNIAPPKTTLDFLKSNPEVLLDLLTRVYRGTDGILQKMAYMMINDARKLLVFELVTECKRNANRQKPHLITLSEGELATHVGLARETVNRHLAKLKSAGLISITKSGISVRDLPALEKLL